MVKTATELAADLTAAVTTLGSANQAVQGAAKGIQDILVAASKAQSANANDLAVATLPSSHNANELRKANQPLRQLALDLASKGAAFAASVSVVVDAVEAIAQQVEMTVPPDPDPEPEPEPEPQPDPEPGASVATREVTWSFKDPVGMGRFCTGDGWSKPALLVGISPGVLVEGTRTRNGSMVNPDPQDGQAQGYDSAMYAQYAEGGSYQDALNIGKQLPYALKAGTSLITSISVGSASARPTVRAMEILTVLNDTPPPDAFRPPYAGVDKTIPGRASDLDYSKLRNVAAEPGAPSWTTVARMVERPYADDCLPEWPGRYRRAVDNMEDYGRDIATQVGVAALRLATAGTEAEKRATDIGLIQVGIDMYGILKDGGYWPAREGHMQGRLLPILYAGMRLGNAKMLSVTKDYPLRTFSENCQTGFKADGTPDWEQRLCIQPGRPDDGYDVCCTGNSFVPMALAARLLGLEDAWGHDAFFKYTEWYLNQSGLKDYEKAWGPWGAWVLAMWAKYWPVA